MADKTDTITGGEMSSDNENSSLVATRSRRANAGNKMKKLLEQELQEMQERAPSAALEAADQDDINLLFQEEEDDQEFTIDDRKRDEDELFSDSGDESDGADEDDEEHELERQERKRRKLASRKKIPVIRRRAEKEEKPKKPQYEQPSAESLLLRSRRTSKRSSVVANKLQVYQKLTEAEKKRKEIRERIQRQKEKQEHQELTQEDRLRQALDTERINLLSLNKYKEQELSKKQNRMAMQLRNRSKFVPGELVLSMVSAEWRVTPVMEVKDHEHWQQQLARRTKKKKKYTKKRKEPQEREGGSATEAKAEIGDKTGTDGVQKTPERDESTSIDSVVLAETDNPDNREEAVAATHAGKETDALPTHNANQHSEADVQSENEPTAKVSEPQDSRLATPTETHVNQECSAENTDHSEAPRTSTSILVAYPTEQSANLPHNDQDTSAHTEPVDGECATSPPRHQQDRPRQVSFAVEDDIAIIDFEEPPSNIGPSKEPSSEPASIAETSAQDVKLENTPELTNDEDTHDDTEPEPETEEEPVFEGPEQRVGKEFLTLYTYPEGAVKPQDVRATIFGEEALYLPSRRSQEVETIFKSTKEELTRDSNSILPATVLPDLTILDKFPAFGEYDRKLSQDVAIEANKELKIEIKTQAPTGVFLPNGVRKKCLITNKDSQYFDPKNGVPYSDVEAYKTIQELQDPIGTGTEEEPSPRYQWFGFGRGGIYLDVSQRPARGVPENF